MALDHHGAGAEEAAAARAALQGHELLLPPSPLFHERRADGIEAFQDAGSGSLSSLPLVFTKAEGEQEAVRRRLQGNLAGESHVAVLRPVVEPGHPEVPGEVLPSVGGAGEARRTAPPRERGGQRQGVAVPPREKHGHALVIAAPGRVAGAAVVQMRGEQDVEPVALGGAGQGLETDALEEHGAGRVREDLLLDSVAALPAGVLHAVERDALLGEGDGALGVALLLREKGFPVGDDELEVPDAGRIEPGKVDLVHDAVAQRVPERAGAPRRGADAALGAGGPGGRDARPTGGEAW